MKAGSIFGLTVILVTSGATAREIPQTAADIARSPFFTEAVLSDLRPVKQLRREERSFVRREISPEIRSRLKEELDATLRKIGWTEPGHLEWEFSKWNPADPREDYNLYGSSNGEFEVSASFSREPDGKAGPLKMIWVNLSSGFEPEASPRELYRRAFGREIWPGRHNPEFDTWTVTENAIALPFFDRASAYDTNEGKRTLLLSQRKPDRVINSALAELRRRPVEISLDTAMALGVKALDKHGAWKRDAWESIQVQGVLVVSRTGDFQKEEFRRTTGHFFPFEQGKPANLLLAPQESIPGEAFIWSYRIKFSEKDNIHLHAEVYVDAHSGKILSMTERRRGW